MIFLAAAISLLPGIFSLVMDPDLLGISIFIVHAFLVYLAWRFHSIGGIALIVLAAAWLGLMILNLPMSLSNIFLWVIIAACPLAGGILFIYIAKRKQKAVHP